MNAAMIEKNDIFNGSYAVATVNDPSPSSVTVDTPSVSTSSVLSSSGDSLLLLLLLDQLDDLPLSMIIAYVGINQYRFVASINKRFRDIYLKVFPGNKRTTICVSTVQQAKICIEEVRKGSSYRFEYQLCRTAARHGNLLALQFFRQIACPWSR